MHYYIFRFTFLLVKNRLGGAPAAYFIETTEVCRFIHTLHWWHERYLNA